MTECFRIVTRVRNLPDDLLIWLIANAHPQIVPVDFRYVNAGHDFVSYVTTIVETDLLEQAWSLCQNELLTDNTSTGDVTLGSVNDSHRMRRSRIVAYTVLTFASKFAVLSTLLNKNLFLKHQFKLSDHLKTY